MEGYTAKLRLRICGGNVAVDELLLLPAEMNGRGALKLFMLPTATRFFNKCVYFHYTLNHEAFFTGDGCNILFIYS